MPTKEEIFEKFRNELNERYNRGEISATQGRQALLRKEQELGLNIEKMSGSEHRKMLGELGVSKHRRTSVKTYVRAHATRMVENGILNITGANTLKILGLLAPDGYTMTQKMHNMVVPRMTAPKYNEMEIQDFAGRFADEIRQIMEGSFWKQ